MNRMLQLFTNKRKIRTASGMTLVEVFVAIAIMLIAMEGMTLLFIRSWDNNKFIIETGVASLTASRAVTAAVNDLRRAQQADNGDYPIEAGDDFEVTFYANVDDDDAVERVHYYLATEQFWRGVTDPTAANPPVYPAGDSTTTKIADFVVNEADNPAFFYYDDTYPANTTPLATPIAVDGPRLVQVHLLVNIDPVHAPNNINIESFAELRNLNDYE